VHQPNRGVQIINRYSTRSDALAFRSYWQARILAGEVEVDTGNKSIGHVAGMVRVINETKTLGLPAIFERTSITGGKQKQRVAYVAEFVQAAFMAEGVFDDLNPEARRIIYLVAETGLRLPAKARTAQWVTRSRRERVKELREQPLR
jgi:hypothetical protein